jgi:hypothetical protein
LNSAVDVLRRETDVPPRSVAAELYEWGEDREPLTNRTNRDLLIDEVSTLGTARGTAHEGHERGAVVIIERGSVRENTTQDGARSAVVDHWRAIESSGVECVIERPTPTASGQRSTPWRASSGGTWVGLPVRTGFREQRNGKGT